MDLIDIIRGCQQIIRELRKNVSRGKSAHVNKAELLEDIKNVVDGYFRTDRPLLIQEVGSAALLVPIDGLMQELLSYSQVRTRKARYIDVLGSLERAWREIEIGSLQLSRPMVGLPQTTGAQQVLTRNLEKVCPAAALCYHQALIDLSDSSRLSWRGTATELREALRELLDTLAPDAEVEKAPGFKLEPNARYPTMKQKTRFILRSRQWSEAARIQVEQATDVIDEKVGGFVRSVYSGSSASVHSSREKREVQSVLRFVELCMSELLELESMQN